MAIGAFCARGAVPVTTSDSVTYAHPYAGFRVNVGGTVHFLDGLGNEHTWDLVDGGREAIEVSKIFSTGTTATGITVFMR